jgi:hypothetical protein
MRNAFQSPRAVRLRGPHQEQNATRHSGGEEPVLPIFMERQHLSSLLDTTAVLIGYRPAVQTGIGVCVPTSGAASSRVLN